jgi:hypothetical protein
MLEGTCEKLGYCWNTLRATTDELPKWPDETLVQTGTLALL